MVRLGKSAVVAGLGAAQWGIVVLDSAVRRGYRAGARQ